MIWSLKMEIIDWEIQNLIGGIQIFLGGTLKFKKFGTYK